MVIWRTNLKCILQNVYIYVCINLIFRSLSKDWFKLSLNTPEEVAAIAVNGMRKNQRHVFMDYFTTFAAPIYAYVEYFNSFSNLQHNFIRTSLLDLVLFRLFFMTRSMII